MDRGPAWTVDRGPWTVDRGPALEDRGPWTVDRGPAFEDRGPWTVDRGPAPCPLPLPQTNETCFSFFSLSGPSGGCLIFSIYNKAFSNRSREDAEITNQLNICG